MEFIERALDAGQFGLIVNPALHSGKRTIVPHNNSLQESRVGKSNSPMTVSVCDLENRLHADLNRMNFKLTAMLANASILW